MIAFLLAFYLLAVSVLYTVLYTQSPATAEGLVVFFVALLLVPVFVREVHRAYRHRR